MSKSDNVKLAHLLEHHPDAENGYCELCEAASISSVLLPHAMALAERSEIAPLLMAAELAAQSIEGIAHAEDLDLELVLAAVKRRVKDLKGEREAESAGLEGSPVSRLHH